MRRFLSPATQQRSLFIGLAAVALAAVPASGQTIGFGIGYLESLPSTVYLPNVPETHGDLGLAPNGVLRSTTWTVSYRQVIRGRLVFQPEAQYARYRADEMRSADLTIPLLFRYGAVPQEGGPLGIIATAGVAPSFQVSCTWAEPVFRWRDSDPATRRAPCTTAPLHTGYSSRRLDLMVMGGFGVEVRAPGDWIVGAELRLARGLLAVSRTHPELRAQNFHLAFQLVPPIRGSAEVPRR